MAAPDPLPSGTEGAARRSGNEREMQETCGQMSRKKPKPDEIQTDAPAVAAPEPEPGLPEAQAPPPTEAEKPPELAAAEQEIERLRDENLRLVAELRNLRQRTQREKAEALKYAEADFARELLVLLDDLERAQAAAPAAENVQALAEGVRIVHEHFLKVLRDRGIQPIEALGRPFDPELHQALSQQPSAECPAGTVMQELARGYRMHGRVIRPAKVVVSSGPPATAPQEPDDDIQTDAKGSDDAHV